MGNICDDDDFTCNDESTSDSNGGLMYDEYLGFLKLLVKSK